MTDTITLTGLVATEPRHLTTGDGLPLTSFRLASSQEPGDTNWYTVVAAGRLAANAAQSIHKQDRVIVTGRLRIRDWATTDRAGISVEVDADAIGHDLYWGTSQYTRNTTQTEEQSR